MPSNALDAYGLMLSAIIDPNPVLGSSPQGVLLRIRGEALIPGEPADSNLLKEMIDAPVHDRSKWEPQWPDVEEHLVRDRRSEFASTRHPHDCHQLWPHVADVCAGG